MERVPFEEFSGNSRNLPFSPLRGLTTTACLAERKAVGFSPSAEEFDLEGSILNAAPLADQLVEALIIRSALALTVDVGSMGCACGLAIDKDAKPHRSGTFGRSHHEVD